MISGQELFIQRARIKSSLETSLQRAYENGIDAAEKTRLYRIVLAQKMLELKEQGIQISILEKLAKGSEQVSRAEFEMNVAEVKYAASKENIMAQKKLLDSIEDDIKREYARKE